MRKPLQAGTFAASSGFGPSALSGIKFGWAYIFPRRFCSVVYLLFCSLMAF